MPFRPLIVLLALFACRCAFAADAAVSHYTLRYTAENETMAVRLCVAHAAARVHFTADAGAQAFVDALHRESSAPLARDDDGWTATNWRAGECLDYTATLGRIVNTGRRELGARHGGAIVLDPGTWLLRVAHDDADGSAYDEARVALPAGFSISAPWHPEPSADDMRHFRIPRTPSDWIARVAIGRFDERSVALAGGVLRVAIVDDVSAVERDKLDAWMTHVGRAAASAIGHLPLADVQVLIVPERETTKRPVVFGESARGQGHGVTLFADTAQPIAALDSDWVAVHELSHLFHPYLDDRGSWLAEGLATYYQNVLRARGSLLTPAQAWEQIDAGFARGRAAMPTRADALDRAASANDARPQFLRIYWTGTAFWLESDAELRRASGNRLSVDEALKRFDACCLPSYRGWTPEEFVDKLDALIGSDVFRKRFDVYRSRVDFPNLDALYQSLGIRRDGAKLVYDEDAPLANVRCAIMAPPPGADEVKSAR
jgi:hypothetical protein